MNWEFHQFISVRSESSAVKTAVAVRCSSWRPLPPRTMDDATWVRCVNRNPTGTRSQPSNNLVLVKLPGGIHHRHTHSFNKPDGSGGMVEHVLVIRSELKFEKDCAPGRPYLVGCVIAIHWRHVLQYLTAFGGFHRPPWKELSYRLQKRPCTGPARTWFLCKTWCLWITVLCKTALCVKDGSDAKTLVLFKPRFKFKPKHVCKPGFWKRPYWKRLWKRPYLERLCDVMRVKGVRHKSQWIKYWI